MVFDRPLKGCTTFDKPYLGCIDNEKSEFFGLVVEVTQEYKSSDTIWFRDDITGLWFKNTEISHIGTI